jgi:hypothetical protein
MAIISFDETEIIDYIPEAERNAEKPCTVRTRFVPYKKILNYTRQMKSEFAAASEGVKSAARMSEVRNDIERKMQRRQFTESVAEILNYSIKGRAITDPGEFYDTADAELVTEILLAMQSAQTLTEGQRKNSSGPSDGA